MFTQSNTMTVPLKEPTPSQIFIRKNKTHKPLSLWRLQQIAPDLGRPCADNLGCSEFIITMAVSSSRLLQGNMHYCTGCIGCMGCRLWPHPSLCLHYVNFISTTSLNFELNSKRLVCSLIGPYRSLIMR